MSERRTTLEMVGEYLREIAVLVVVFVPLDAIFSGKLTVSVVLATMAISAGFLVTGIWAERGR
jgi:hypothetical protein